MGTDQRWTSEEWRKLQTSLFSVTGNTRIKLSSLTPEQWDKVVKGTGRTKADIDAALTAMLKRQDLPGGRVPVQITERLFRESVPHLRNLNLGDDARREKILAAVSSFDFATLPYDDLFLVWNSIGSVQGILAQHECLRCVYSVLGQITNTQLQRMDAEAKAAHKAAHKEHRIRNPPPSKRTHSASASADGEGVEGKKGDAGPGAVGVAAEGIKQVSLSGRVRGPVPGADEGKTGGGGTVVKRAHSAAPTESMHKGDEDDEDDDDGDDDDARNDAPAGRVGRAASSGVSRPPLPGGGTRFGRRAPSSESSGVSEGARRGRTQSPSGNVRAGATAGRRVQPGLEALEGDGPSAGVGSLLAWSRKRSKEERGTHNEGEGSSRRGVNYSSVFGPGGMMKPPGGGPTPRQVGMAHEPDMIYSLGGPILFTAPHSLNIVRGGRNGERRRIHKRERYSSELVLKLAAFATEFLGQPASYIIWNRMMCKKGDPRLLDPNYLTQSQSPYSTWHHALHNFSSHFTPSDPAEGAQGAEATNTPVFHIDVHGKMDRKDNLDLDIGLGPMEHCWADKDDAEGRAEVAALKEHLAAGMREAFKCVKAKTFLVHNKQMHMTVEEDPYLNAYWGLGTFETISHQSVNLRMPAIQLEIPHTMRKELLTNEVLFKNFATALMHSYKYCVSNIKTIHKKPSVCGCNSVKHDEAFEAARQGVLRENGKPASKGADDTEVMLRELHHLERTTSEKQI